MVLESGGSEALLLISKKFGAQAPFAPISTTPAAAVTDNEDGAPLKYLHSVRFISNDVIKRLVGKF